MSDYTLELADAGTVRLDLQPTLLWTDPPYGTGKRQARGGHGFTDHADTAYVVAAITAWLPAMAPDGTVVTCCDYRLAADLVVGVKRHGWVHRGEVVWQFGLGRPRTSWWPVRHNTLLTFTRTPDSGLFDPTAAPRTERLAPKPGYPTDKPAGSVWDYTLSNTHPARVGYPNQKPVEIIRPFVLAHTRPGDLVLDPFAGSSSTGAAALATGRRFHGIDSNPAALAVSHQRLTEGARRGVFL